MKQDDSTRRPDAKPKIEPWNDAKAQRMQKKLSAWYEIHGRHDLPWRRTKDPYAIYISEIMLQQTQVKTVLERFYHPFLTKFPDLASLASAPSDQVMKAWEGLGYYTRARNLQRAAQTTGKTLPSSVEGLLALPGIGRNTAHAVASFGFGLPVPVMEANVKRVLCRIFGIVNPQENMLWQHAEYLMNKHEPFLHNQAMMDVGAIICTPRKPHCIACPFQIECIASTNDPEAFPAPKVRKSVPTRHRLLLAFETPQGKIYMPKRETRLLGGLHGFPQADADAKVWEGKSLLAGRNLGKVRHIYSHFKLEGEVRLLSSQIFGQKADWYDRRQLTDLPLSKIDRNALALLTD